MSHCYCITLRTAARRMTSIYDDALEPVGVNIGQFSMLRRIGRAGSLCLTELGRVTDLDRSTVGRNAKVLARMGLVRTGAGQDQREATIALTDAGRRVLEVGAPLWDQAQARIETALGGPEASRLLALLDAL